MVDPENIDVWILRCARFRFIPVSTSMHSLGVQIISWCTHILDISFNYVSADSNNRIHRNWSYTENKFLYSVVSQY